MQTLAARLQLASFACPAPFFSLSACLAGAIGFALQVPYGFRALLLHRSLSTGGAQEQQWSRAPSVRILRDVRCGGGLKATLYE